MSTKNQRQIASRTTRKRVPRLKWRESIVSYDAVPDKRAWALDPSKNTEGITSVKQTISHWRSLLKKEKEEENSDSDV